MRRLLSFQRWPGLAVAELKLDIEILRTLTRRRWLSTRAHAQLRRSLAWRKDLLQLVSGSESIGLLQHVALENAPQAPEPERRGPSQDGIAGEVRRFTAPSADFEEVDPEILGGRTARVKLIAFYLPQFHPFPENDSWWGAGFTEWTNVARGIPRFRGHYQPRIPRDLGFYDLRDDRTMRRQIEMAKNGGIHGFCFYYYNFDGKRLLEMPLERFLADPSLDMPFCLMWANENWTRRWDGAESEILMMQSYGTRSIEDLVDDLARHIRDPRYIRIAGRPLVIVYRPNVIPDAKGMVERWRALFKSRHGEEPLLFMVQAFGSDDPAEFGFDGAIEFPPHKLQHRAANANGDVEIYDPAMTGQIFRYRDFITASQSFRAPDYPLLRTLFPSWDNDARRQGHGMTTFGSTPGLYRYWLDRLIGFSQNNPVLGESMVFINAWNEWAEGTYLEPDLHFGGAYLNETARAAVGMRSRSAKQKLLLVGHDAHPHGAQELLLNIGEMLKSGFGCEVEFLLLGDGPLLDRYRAVAPTRVVTAAGAAAAIDALSADGFSDAVVNSLASGSIVQLLTSRFFRVVTLVHELPQIIRERGLEAVARDVALASNELVFPSAMVRDAFRGVVGGTPFQAIVRPQGLYKPLADTLADRDAVRAEFGLPPGARLVVDVGYGDMRKGLDLFADLAAAFGARDPDVHFVWIGLVEAETAARLGDRLKRPNLHFAGQRSDVGRLLASADVFVLASREDPFPSVVLEALACGLPVVGFEGAGGFTDLFDRPETGLLVPKGDIAAMTAAVAGLLAVPEAERARAADLRRRRIVDDFSFRDYAFWLLRRFDPQLASVSVVVPNYNYARYLEARLTSIFAQSYPIYEIIVLDDASTDDSVEMARAVAAAAGRRVRIETGESNSGNVFVQWRKGVGMARGDLVWIAEADDLSQIDFVATMAQKFVDPNLSLAFSDSATIDAEGRRRASSYQYYYTAVHGSAMARSFTLDGQAFAKRFLAECNMILNGSSVVWRRSALETALAAAGTDIAGFSLAGDWLLYLRTCHAGGTVAFDARPLNLHRRALGVTARTRGEVQIDEIRRIYAAFDELFGPPADAGKRREAYLEELRRRFSDSG